MLPPLAMHMANELLSLPVAAGTVVLAAAIVAFSAWRARHAADASRLPLMGVLGAFVFAAQMINFPVLPGTSGHLGGAVLLAVLLGPWAAILTLTAILIAQCLLFADGGLLALGCNVINIAVVPALLGATLYRLIQGRTASPSAARQYLAAWLAATAGVTAGAALVPLEMALSAATSSQYVLRIPLQGFLSAMLGVHLLIGLAEGAITFSILAYLRRVRPELLGLRPLDGDLHPPPGAAASGAPLRPARPGYRAVFASLLVTALLLAGVGSWFASTWKDGLEANLQPERYNANEVICNDELAVAQADALQARLAPLPDYSRQPPATDSETPTAGQAVRWPNVDGWGSAAGVIGTLVTLILTYSLARMLRSRARTGH